MGKGLRTLFWLLTLLALGYDLFLWGGLAVTPTIGRQLREQASLESPMAASYLFLGRHLVESAHLQSRAMNSAAKQFAGPVSDTESSPLMIVERFLSAQKAVPRLAYYGAPIL